MHRRQWLQWTGGLSLGHSKVRSYWVAGERSAVIRPPSEQFLRILPKLMEIAQLPGVGIGIVQQRSFVWSHYAGVANTGKTTPLTADSLFPAASLGKPVFSYVVLQLVQEGRLALDTPLHQYLDDDTLQDDRARKITARHVLSHSSGLVNWRSGSGEPLSPQFEPGTRFRYSGEGFYILQRVVEKITGSGLEHLMQERLFAPLGMHASTYLWHSDADRRLVAGHRGTEPFYNREFASELWQRIQASHQPLQEWNSDRIVEAMSKKDSTGRRPQPNETVPNIAFSLLTTVPDYSKFLARFLDCQVHPSDLKPTTLAELAKPYSRINSALSWGLGWGLEQQPGRSLLWQWGDNGGWKNFVLVDLPTGSAVVVFTNGDKGMRVVERIINAASGQENLAFLWV